MCKPKVRTCGFRFSMVDATAIAICIAATYLLWGVTSGHIVAFPFVLCHFFLFCNIFRIRRKLELIWAGVFLVNATCWLCSSQNWYVGVLVVQLPITASVIGIGMFSKNYHGIFARQINHKHIDAYLRGKV